jgi:hypothetical protein
MTREDGDEPRAQSYAANRLDMRSVHTAVDANRLPNRQLSSTTTEDTYSLVT